MSDPAIGKHGQLAQGGDNSLDALLAVAVGHQARVLVVLLQDALAQNPARKEAKGGITYRYRQCCGSGSAFLDLLDPDPDPLVRGMDPAQDQDPSIIKQK